MNPAEAVAICRVVAAMCPAQKLDEHTPDAWALVLDDIRLEDAKAAVVALGKRQPWISPAEIRAEVARIRAKRIGEAILTPPADLDEAETIRWIADARRRLGDGEPLEAVQGNRGMPAPRPVAALIASVDRASTLPDDVRRARRAAYEQGKAAALGGAA